jgi:NAD-dependent deacetylase
MTTNDRNKLNMNASTIQQGIINALQVAKHVVNFTGAGVSAESGIPTFRDSRTGLWERFEAEDLATPSAFRKDKELVWGWYEWRRMKVLPPCFQDTLPASPKP